MIITITIIKKKLQPSWAMAAKNGAAHSNHQPFNINNQQLFEISNEFMARPNPLRYALRVSR